MLVRYVFGGACLTVLYWKVMFQIEWSEECTQQGSEKMCTLYYYCCGECWGTFFEYSPKVIPPTTGICTLIVEIPEMKGSGLTKTSFVWLALGNSPCSPSQFPKMVSPPFMSFRPVVLRGYRREWKVLVWGVRACRCSGVDDWEVSTSLVSHTNHMIRHPFRRYPPL